MVWTRYPAFCSVEIATACGFSWPSRAMIVAVALTASASRSRKRASCREVSIGFFAGAAGGRSRLSVNTVAPPSEFATWPVPVQSRSVADGGGSGSMVGVSVS